MVLVSVQYVLGVSLRFLVLRGQIATVLFLAVLSVAVLRLRLAPQQRVVDERVLLRVNDVGVEDLRHAPATWRDLTRPRFGGAGCVELSGRSRADLGPISARTIPTTYVRGRRGRRRRRSR